MKKIYFDIKSHFRDRQWDTVRNVPKGVEALYAPGVEPMGVVRATARSRGTWMGRVKRWIARALPLVKTVSIPAMAAEADIVYTWGALPRGTTKPYVVEFDNPFCATYYNARAARWHRRYIHSRLASAMKIVCMSEACRAHLLSVYGADLATRTEVLYPFAPRRKPIARDASRAPAFLFIGIDYRVKGCEETLRAFHDLPDLRATLKVIAPLPDALRERYAGDPRITFMNAVPRATLFNEIFPSTDVLVFPSMYESFGVVALEALSFGLGIIATDTYALPELVEHGVNGFLLRHPFIAPMQYGGRTIVNPVDLQIDAFSERYFKEGAFQDALYAGLKEAFTKGAESFRAWQKGSAELYEARFSEELWKAAFSRIITQ